MLLITVSIPWFLLAMRSRWEIAILVGGLLLYGGIAMGWEKWRKYRTRSWPTAPGQVENLQQRKVNGGINGVDYWKVSFDYSFTAQQVRKGSYTFKCTSENMATGAMAGMQGKTVNIHYNLAKEADAVIWEDEIWDIWWDTYWDMIHPPAQSDQPTS